MLLKERKDKSIYFLVARAGSANVLCRLREGERGCSVSEVPSNFAYIAGDRQAMLGPIASALNAAPLTPPRRAELFLSGFFVFFSLGKYVMDIARSRRG